VEIENLFTFSIINYSRLLAVMTTANRPTYHAAVGRQNYGGFHSRLVSVKDQLAYTKLKFRQVGQASVSEKRDRNVVKNELDTNEFIQGNSAVAKPLVASASQLLLENGSDSKLEKPIVGDSQMIKNFDDADVSIAGSDFDSSRYFTDVVISFAVFL
jgi:hypothetical protein